MLCINKVYIRVLQPGKQPLYSSTPPTKFISVYCNQVNNLCFVFKYATNKVYIRVLQPGKQPLYSSTPPTKFISEYCNQVNNLCFVFKYAINKVYIRVLQPGKQPLYSSTPPTKFISESSVLPFIIMYDDFDMLRDKEFSFIYCIIKLHFLMNNFSTNNGLSSAW